MAEAATDITKATTAFAKDLTTWLKKKRDAKIAELKKKEEAEKKAQAKKGDPKTISGSGGAKAGSGGAKKDDKPTDWDKQLHTVTFRCSTRTVTLTRTPEAQATEVAKHSSWSCASAHMVDKARHVEMVLNGKLSWELKTAFGTGDKQFVTEAAFWKYFGTLFSTHNVVNASGKPEVHGKDKFHLELADAKVPRSDKKVKECMDCYAKKIYLEVEKHPKGPNSDFEKNFKSAELAASIKKYKAQREKIDKERDREALKALRFDGAVVNAGSAFKDAAKATSFKWKARSDIMPPSPIRAGAGKPTSVSHKLTTKAKSMVGGTVFVSLAYTYWTFENLSQGFVSDVELEIAANLSKAQGMINTLSATYQLTIGLSKSKLQPSGALIVQYVLDGLGNYDHVGVVAFAVSGNTIKTKTNK